MLFFNSRVINKWAIGFSLITLFRYSMFFRFNPQFFKGGIARVLEPIINFIFQYGRYRFLRFI